MRKLICFLLTVAFCMAVTATATAESLSPDSETAADALARYEAQSGEKVETHRYYFIMPDGIHGIRDDQGELPESWYNEYSQGAGIYWWDTNAPAYCESWPGYRAMVEDAEQGIYYVDMPADASFLIWNNGVDGGQDPDQPIFQKMKSSISVPCGYAEPDEWATVPEGCDSFDGCIFVPFVPNIYSEYQPNRPVSGSWYFYYGDGCYGMYAEDSEHFTDIEHNCCNPDHVDANGKHIGFSAPIRGDYDWDKTVTVLDATRAQRVLADTVTDSNPAHIKNVDADGDGELTIVDATRIQRVIAGLCDFEGHTYEEYELPLNKN